MENHINFSQWFGIPELIAGISLRNMQGKNDVIRSKLARVFQLSGEGMCTAVQTHSNRVKFVNKPLQNHKVDGFIARNKNIVLSIKVADCIPLFLHDDKTGLFGLIHSGWRGTVGEIAINSIKKMIQNGGNPSHIRAVIGPSICQNHFEVKNDIVSQFPSKFVVPKKDESFRVDLKEMVIGQLISMGISSNSIYDSDLCTFCREDLFHSYRRDKELNGRMIAVMGWAESVV